MNLQELDTIITPSFNANDDNYVNYNFGSIMFIVIINACIVRVYRTFNMV